MPRQARSKTAPALLQPPPPGSALRLVRGACRWTFEFPLFRNPAILFWGWKVTVKLFGWTCGALWLLFAAIALFESGLDAARQLSSLSLWLGIYAIFIALWPLDYLLLAILYGGKYGMNFKMDSAGVSHAATPRQHRKARGAGAAAGVLAAASGSFGAVGAARLLGTSGTVATPFASVESGRASRRRSVFFLNEFSVNRHQVYVEPRDFDFVLDFIRSHVPPEARAGLQG